MIFIIPGQTVRCRNSFFDAAFQSTACVRVPCQIWNPLCNKLSKTCNLWQGTEEVFGSYWYNTQGLRKVKTPWVKLERVCFPWETTSTSFRQKVFHFEQTWKLLLVVSDARLNFENFWREVNFETAPSNFHKARFLLVVRWLPETSTLCFFPGERGRLFVWNIKKH